MTDDDAYHVLRHYPQIGSISRLESLGNAGGFSGAQLWRVTAAGDVQFCLRAWPEGEVSSERLDRLGRLLKHVAATSGVPVAMPLDAAGNQTFAVHRGRLWELALWLPGEPLSNNSFTTPTLRAAMEALAHLHLAASTFKGANNPKNPGIPFGIEQRKRQLDALRDSNTPWSKLLGAKPSDWPQLSLLADHWSRLFQELSDYAAEQITLAQELPVPLQICFLDIRREHVFFTGDRVTGVVDFGATQQSSVAGDIARLLGSLVGDSAEGWAFGVQCYEAMRPLAANERALIPIFDFTGQLLGPAFWFHWIGIENRTFENRVAIEPRIAESLARLEHRRNELRSGGKLADKGISGIIGKVE